MDKTLLAVFEEKGFQVTMGELLPGDEPALVADNEVLLLTKNGQTARILISPHTSIAGAQEAASWVDYRLGLLQAKEQ